MRSTSCDRSSPEHEPYRAWRIPSSVHPMGLFLFRSGEAVRGGLRRCEDLDRETDSRTATVRQDPLIAADFKVKRSFGRCSSSRGPVKRSANSLSRPARLCSGQDLNCELQGNGRLRVCLRDREAAGETPGEGPGIMVGIDPPGMPGARTHCQGNARPPHSRVVSQAMDQAGIRPSQRHRKVSDYLLGTRSGHLALDRLGHPATSASQAPWSCRLPGGEVGRP